jgi:hypothetical protein
VYALRSCFGTGHSSCKKRRILKGYKFARGYRVSSLIPSQRVRVAEKQQVGFVDSRK